MDPEDNESAKDRPQVDVKYRPGTLSLSGNKASEDFDQNSQKSPYEKMLEDETEKENRRRQANDYGFVLGTPTNESDGAILFNYDEPPKPVLQEDKPQVDSFNMDSDSSLNNTLRRAIREQHDRGNKRFMEGGSSDSSLESGVSNADTDQPNGELENGNVLDVSNYTMSNISTQKAPVTQENVSEKSLSTFKPRPEDVNTSIPQAEIQRTVTGQDSTTVETNELQQQYHLLIQQKSPQEQMLQQHLMNQQREEVSPTTQPNIIVGSHSATSENTSDASILPPNTPQTNSGKVKKFSFFKRLFSSKKHD